jgi:hypothetical protein
MTDRSLGFEVVAEARLLEIVITRKEKITKPREPHIHFCLERRLDGLRFRLTDQVVLLVNILLIVIE